MFAGGGIPESKEVTFGKSIFLAFHIFLELVSIIFKKCKLLYLTYKRYKKAKKTRYITPWREGLSLNFIMVNVN